ncbi:MAG: metallophosphoesterase [Lentimicrobium sp.]|jgi:Icc-related predicted phosphoesterase|nr:metallophosphoesterase [Lentimicrobium sp.]
MTTCYFVSDLHGSISRYELLFREMIRNKPSFVFLGGDLLPHIHRSARLKGENIPDFASDFLIPGFKKVRSQLGCNYPEVFVIMGNDDHRVEEPKFVEAAEKELWTYLNTSSFKFGPYTIYGYPFVPPTPFLLKDWEKYDISNAVSTGSLPPDAGFRTVDSDDTSAATIAEDLEKLTADADMSKAVFLFHSPPYQSLLDQAEVGKPVSSPLHVGSKAILNFIRERQPYLTMHGHIHESARLSGHWQQKFGRTQAFNAAHDGFGLSIIQFQIDNPDLAQRIILDD